MLKNGPYPWPVKQRIKSRLGHLSNVQSVEVVSQVFSEDLKEVILAHLSETNNSSAMVLQTFNDMLEQSKREALRITLASQHLPLDLVEVI
jgi:phosphoribosyl 1,2-cyclic phosphodiesterase